MSIKDHIKHPPIVKPAGGKFHRNELAILGAPCGTIQKLASTIAENLNKEMILGYVDADHGEGSPANLFFTQYTDKITKHSIELEHIEMEYRFREVFNDTDGVIVNGNHFKAQKQIVIINESKRESLSRKLDRLGDVQLFIIDEGSENIFDFILQEFPHYKNIERVSISETVRISDVIKKVFTETPPPLYGLVFAGGKSTRMGKDKGSMVYHDKPQREHMADLLNKFCDRVYLSVAPDTQIDSEYGQIEDTFTGLGPFGGILSAFRMEPNAAWFTVACDIPLLDENSLYELVSSRNQSRMATCFHNPETKFPEPLITIWEPKAYLQLLRFLGTGYNCPRKALINSEVEEINAKDPRVLMNANTPEEFENLRKLIATV